MKSFAEICFFFHLSFCWLYKFIFATDHKFEQITVKCRNDPMIELKMTFVIDACKMRSVQSNLFPRKMYWRKFNLAGLVSFEAHLQFRSTVRAILFDTDKFICEKKTGKNMKSCTVIRSYNVECILESPTTYTKHSGRFMIVEKILRFRSPYITIKTLSDLRIFSFSS